MTREEAIRILENLYDELTDMLEILDDEGGDICGSCLDEQKAVEIAITNLKISVQSDNIQKTLNGIFDNDKVNRLNPPEPTMPISCSEKPNECKENDTLANLDCVQELENAIGLIQQNGKDWLDERDIPILEEAIKAMKTKTCEDCISRQAALLPYAELYDDDVISVRTIRDNIKYLPTVQPQKVGRWIPMHHSFEGVSDTYFVHQYMCSECKALSYFRRDSEQKIINGAICPNCMAKMEEGE